MNKGLEELKSVGRTFVSINNGIALDECDKYKTIEKELKRLEEYDKTIPFLTKKLAQKLKKEKALEIIDEKNVDIGLLKITKTVETYNKEIKKILFGYDDGELTQEEYDLLKEVLK